MTDPLTFAYVALAVFVMLLIGLVVVGILVWRDACRHIGRISERMETRRAMMDRSVRGRG